MKGKIRLITLIMLVVMISAGITFADGMIQRGDKISIFKSIRVPNDVTADGTYMAIFGDVQVDGMIDGDAAAIFGSVKVNGIVDGDVLSVFGRVDMGPNSTIMGDKLQVMGGASSRPGTAIVRGEEINIAYFNNIYPGIEGLILIILALVTIKTIFGFMFSLLLVAMAPERMDKITDSVTLNIPRNFGIGLLVVLGYYIFSAIGAMIVIGLPIIAILVPLMFLLGFAGNTAIKLAIGRRIGKDRGWSRISQLIVGTIIYWILELTIILKPILYLAKLVGMGAIVDTKVGTVNHWGDKKDDISPAYNVVNRIDEPKTNEPKQEINNQNDNKDNKSID